MTDNDEVGTSQAQTLCKSCGLCCTGHLFIWTKLKSNEVAPAQELGLKVFGSEPRQRGFSQPCTLWNGQCTIYTSSHYPHSCHTYKCKLLKEVRDENIPLPEALTFVQQTKGMIKYVDALLPDSQNTNFRERLVEHLEHLKESAKRGNKTDLEFQLKAGELLTIFEKQFGVKELIDHLEG